MSNSGLQFRLATLADAEDIRQLVESAFRAEDSREGWTADMEIGSRFRLELNHVVATISNPDRDILIANIDGHLVASIEISRREGNRARFSMIAVDLSHQQAGVGRQVLAFAEQYCQKTWGVTTGELNALSTRKKLISWYMRQGYHKNGKSTPFPRDRFGDLALPEDLRFMDLEKDFSSTA
ncbi:GNAT family acetyltransferase [Penicillium macrosclerotiorum]|uniref:GNAT family acetyltransferase n=1 Tax=Penicillium macrosclerotiorum TaxID=303699 RepID=UPI0025480192|nr:GNAT family acetyltransferase [Penicillium macrosclerotiorum]KAJ5689065.1 GNAT family acetyltransferase [Penicillium macrosclerotiorum]